MSFESQHGLAVDGIAGPLVWSALLSAINSGAGDTAPYGYVYVSKALPETATIYQNGNAVFSTPVNTGVPGAVTPDGTFTVYERFVSTTMSGTDPNGVKYVDPGIPWVSYFYQGDALHGYVRAQYGFPQSNGCVEMPPANAKIVWPMTPIGTLVTVAN
jgi:lipoprotein-anchoring transpeptidase ErfK/SrfK